MRTAEALIVAYLRARGASRVWGDPLGDLPVEACADPDTVGRLCAADGRLHRVGVGWDAPANRLTIASRPGPAPVQSCDDPGHIARVIDTATRRVASGHEAFVIDIGFELDAEVPARARPRVPQGYTPFAGRLLTGDHRVAMLAGPGVARSGAVEALHRFAAAANVGVANTWGAKGLFRWDSPHHMGTVGLQQRDFALVFDAVDLVLTTGLDRDETQLAFPDHVSVVPIDARQLDHLVALVHPSARIEPNAFYSAVGAVVQPGYVDERRPYHPARVVAMLRAELPAGGVIAAPADRVGRWIARTFSTTDLGSVVVPARASALDAAAIVTVAGFDGRRALLALQADDDGDDITALLDRVGDRGPAPSRATWDSDTLPIDWSCDDLLRDAVGEFVF